MIRIRDNEGNAEIVSGAAVEICSQDGKLIRLIVPDGYYVFVYDSSDEKFHRYCDTVGMEIAEEIGLEEH